MANWKVTLRRCLGVCMLAACSYSLRASADQKFPGDLVLKSTILYVNVSRETGAIRSITNRLTGENLQIGDSGFQIQAAEFALSREQATVVSVRPISASVIVAEYRPREGLLISVIYTLGPSHNFLEESVSVVSTTPFAWKSATIGKFRFPQSNLQFISYRHQKMVTYFGRSRRGGVFIGTEAPFDASSLDDGEVTLGQEISLRVATDQQSTASPVYIGVYRRTSRDERYPETPLWSESDAMVEMTSAMLGPPRHGFAPMACGWWCEMQQFNYQDNKAVDQDLRSLDFLKDLGIQWLSDSHPWGGETDRMNELRLGDRYKPGTLLSREYEYAKKLGIKVVFWPTMNNTHPWWRGHGRPFLLDEPDWLLYPARREITGQMLSGRRIKEAVWGNCIGNRPFAAWIKEQILAGLSTHYFDGWVMDGDFFGGGGIVKPVNCPSAEHNHLAGDATYACDLALSRLIEDVRKAAPDTYTFMCRPRQDEGVFLQRNVDAVFTIDEFGEAEPLPGLQAQPRNMILGDKIRRWSRVRVHQDFFPHYIDQPQVFSGPKGMRDQFSRDWSSEAIDYVMLSAMSSSPNQLYYLPTKTGMPVKDKETIRFWLKWGQEHQDYLMVRRDLPDWPQAGKVDGSAHILRDHGYMFLFNPNAISLPASFTLDSSVGLISGSRYRISCIYPAISSQRIFYRGRRVLWQVPARAAMILELSPLPGSQADHQ